MKYQYYLMTWIVSILLIIGSIEVSAQRTSTMSIGLNRIEGRVTNESNIGVDNAFVELYDNFGSLVNKQRSSGQGRFSFRGMGPGRYTISIKPYGTNLMEESREIEINNQYSRSDTVVVDFRLRVDKRFQNNDLGIIGTVFAQEVPSEARRKYQSGVEKIQSKPEEAVANLEEATRLFPRYFDALVALGKAHIIKGRYEAGYPYLLRAIDINSKCPDCYYSLALAFYKLNEMPAATKAIDAAVLLQPQTSFVRLLQGIIYRLNNDLAGAEKALLLAKSLFKTPNSEVHWQLSLIYNRLNRNQDAADELELYLKTKADMKDSEKESVRDMIKRLRKSK